MTQDNRNMIVAVLMSALVLLGWTFFSEKYFPPAKPVVVASAPIAAPSATTPSATTTASPGVAAAVPGAIPVAGVVAPVGDRKAVLAASPRVIVDTPRLQGSINLKGARFDDLVMTQYRETKDKTSPPVRLLSPSPVIDAWFGQFGWAGPGVPPVDALWTASSTRLTPAAPVTLTWTSPAGVRFEQVIAVDKDFLFTVNQRVANGSAAPVNVQPWGLVSRHGEGVEKTAFNLHVGPIGVIDGTLRDSEIEYKKLQEGGAKTYATTGGWLGITEKYWLAAVIPDQKEKIDARFASAPGDQFQTDFLGVPIAVQPGKIAQTTAHFYAGAKEIKLLDGYMTSLNVPHLDLAISWGWFGFIAQPIYKLLSWLFTFTGNFGLAIICLTLIVRAALFPIANKQYESMAKMRIVAPKMKAIQERNKGDKLKAQQEMMVLYKTEKVNPLAGCLPLVLQIPIFYALYKTLLLSTEMRHQPFALWITDLSAPDPMTPLNLFGLIPWTPPAMIAIGIFPIILGVTMWLQQRMNPTPLDPVQKQVFAIMPWMFMFIMAPFAAGLQLYWIVNNLVSIAQQWFMLRKYPMPATPPEAITVKPGTVKPTSVK
ncbi:membrane protein insertase YidC [Polymorphobacter glacialis]|uniref:Membrane protein insertase YidC n=1 Tax=Sandarakinorhabdus glacialis TaxID=1614636 RepID=A0A916ZSQ9_9SPHN|nr:membrane protein insertase YidC [Polymorphobacter glacialis]GGE10750.1 membrane protein insertase YidC [Polymorphobacter glacialis]